MNGLEKTYQSRIKFTRVNILNPKNAPLLEQYGFSTAPELYLINRDGKIVGSWDDFVSSETLRQAFDRELALDSAP